MSKLIETALREYGVAEVPGENFRNKKNRRTMTGIEIFRCGWNVYNGFFFEVIEIESNYFHGELLSFRWADHIYICIAYIFKFEFTISTQ